MLGTVVKEDISPLELKTLQRVQELITLIEQTVAQAQKIRQGKKNLALAAKINFFKVATQTILTNSRGQTVIVHHNPNFGKRFVSAGDHVNFLGDSLDNSAKPTLPALNIVIDFVKTFHYINE
jgi:16S rRNA G966 N2-methylase RsmD